MDLVFNKEKFKIFLEVSQVLNKHNILPILYGSLGLNRIIGEFTQVNDIDILIPDIFTQERQDYLIKIMKDLNFKIEGEQNHELRFIRGPEVVAFGKTDDLMRLFQMNPDSLSVLELDRVKFKELSVQHHLAWYQFLLGLVELKEKHELYRERITLIKQYLEKLERPDIEEI